MKKIGLRRIVVSDGPSGVRGETWDERDPSLNLPSATALSSSWDPDVARRYGAAAAVEGRRKGVDVVLGPTINLHRRRSAAGTSRRSARTLCLPRSSRRPTCVAYRTTVSAQH
jgi:beta-glucosidase-like glycosyl hydrolase